LAQVGSRTNILLLPSLRRSLSPMAPLLEQEFLAGSFSMLNFIGYLLALWGLRCVLRSLADWICSSRCADDKPVAASTAPSGSQLGTEKSEAQACWAAGFGRYKYCGLREDPLSDREPPDFSTKNLHLAMPPLQAQDKMNMDALRRRTEDLVKDQQHRTDDCTLIRFLRARKGNVDKAECLLRQAAAWRQKHDVNRALSDWNLEAYEQCLAPWWLSGGIIGRGRQGETVGIERLGRSFFPRLAAHLSEDIIQKIDIVHCMRVAAAVEEDAHARRVPLLPFTLVVDMEGFGRDQVQLSAARLLAKLIEGRNLMLTEMCGRILVVRAPAAAVYAWSVLKKLLDRGTVEKVQMATTKDSPALLRLHIDEDVLPAFLGGRRCINGDAECRALLAPGGPVPDEAFQRIQELLLKGHPKKRSPECAKATSKTQSAGCLAGICR